MFPYGDNIYSSAVSEELVTSDMLTGSSHVNCQWSSSTDTMQAGFKLMESF